MNPRIQELAEQAGITTNLDTDFFDKDPNKWVDYYSEKFAELIVQECVNVLHDNELWNRHISHALKEHFGVEQ